MSSFPPYQPAEGDVFVSSRFASDSDGGAALVAAVRTRLRENERLLCVLAVCKISPTLEVLVMTTERVLADDRRDVGRTDLPWSVELPIPDVERIEVTGFMDNVRFVCRDGKGAKVGNLWDGTDEAALQAALVVMTGSSSRVAVVQVRASQGGNALADWASFERCQRSEVRAWAAGTPTN